CLPANNFRLPGTRFALPLGLTLEKSGATGGQAMVGAGEQIAVSEAEGGSPAEAALIRAGLAGDRAALEQLLGPHKRSVLAVCFGILRSAEGAEDAAQDTLLR